MAWQFIEFGLTQVATDLDAWVDIREWEITSPYNLVCHAVGISEVQWQRDPDPYGAGGVTDYRFLLSLRPLGQLWVSLIALKSSCLACGTTVG